MWSTEEIDSRIDEYRGIAPNLGRDELALLATALFIEEVFGIRLSDEEISPAISTYESLRRLIVEKLGLK